MDGSRKGLIFVFSALAAMGLARPSHGSGNRAETAAAISEDVVSGICTCIPATYGHDSVDLWLEIDPKGRAGRFVSRPHLDADVADCLQSRLSEMNFQATGKAHTKQVHLAFPKTCIMAESGWTVNAEMPSMEGMEARKKDILKAGIILTTVGGAFTMLSVALGYTDMFTCESRMFDFFDQERDCRSSNFFFYLAIPGAALTIGGIVAVIIGGRRPNDDSKEPSNKLSLQVAFGPDISRSGIQAALSWRY